MGNGELKEMTFEIQGQFDPQQIEDAIHSSILRKPKVDMKRLRQEIDQVMKHEQIERNKLREAMNEKENIIFHLEKIKKHNYEQKSKRFKFHHKFIKRFAQKLIPFLLNHFNPYLVRNMKDFEAKWHNNLLRIWYYSAHKGITDMWVFMHREMNPHWKAKYGTPSNYMRSYIPWRYGDSDKFTRAIIDLQATEILEDSIDREAKNMEVLNITHEVMKLYGVKEEEMNKVPKAGEFPVWKNGYEFDPKYFLENLNQKVWEEPPEFNYDSYEVDKLNKSKEVKIETKHEIKNETKPEVKQ